MNSFPSSDLCRVPFRERFTAEQRAAECARASKREGYIPTIVEPHGTSAPLLEKEKYLLPADLTSAQLIYVVRKRLRMRQSEALFLFCSGTMIHGATSVRDLHFRFACQEDGFLYVRYSIESAFGRGRP
jgi:GABA(A) receptor-associated protein